MREPERIERILSEIGAIWYANPDWRLGQLYLNLVGHNVDVFYTEDERLEQAITTYQREQKWAALEREAQKFDEADKENK